MRKIYTLIIILTITTACNKYINQNITNQTTKINTQNVAVNINIPLNEKYTTEILNKILKQATLNSTTIPNINSIRKYYEQNNNETIQITTSWKTNHNKTIISSAINTTITKNNQPTPNQIFTITTLNHKKITVENVINLKNKKEQFRNIVKQKFHADNNTTQNTTLIKPLEKFPISPEFILSEKNLTLIYNPQTLTFDNEIVIIEIPYDQITDLMLINRHNIENLSTTEFNAPIL